MFSFFKKKSKADQVIEIMDDAIDISSQAWVYFCEKLKFKDNVPLIDQIIAFLPPITERLNKGYSQLHDAPEEIILIIVAQGIVKSGSHEKEDVEKALGAKLP